MRILIAPLLIMSLLAVAVPTGATPAQVDFAITFHADGGWTYDGPAGMLTPVSEDAGKEYVWDLVIAEDAAIGEIRYTLDAFDLDRAKQLRPMLEPSNSGFPLFHYFARPAVWETTGPAQVYHVHMADDTAVLRLQIPRTADARLSLVRDVTPPTYTLGDVEQITERSFYQETQTDELALAELQVRRNATDGEWVRNPTPDFHILQRFPIQGLDPGTDHDVRAIFTDWSGNNVTSPTYTVRTLLPEHGGPPSFEILGPRPDAILPSGSDVTVKVRVHDGDTPVDPSSLRLFVDLKEQSRFVFDGGIVTYTHPTPPADGLHVVSLEAATLDGASDHVKWQFHVGAATTTEAPALAPLLGVALLALALAGIRRRPHA